MVVVVFGEKGGVRGALLEYCLDEVGFPIGGHIPRQPPPELNNIAVSFLQSFGVMMRFFWWWWWSGWGWGSLLLGWGKK